MNDVETSNKFLETLRKVFGSPITDQNKIFKLLRADQIPEMTANIQFSISMCFVVVQKHQGKSVLFLRDPTE
jgi:hypothetical protein